MTDTTVNPRAALARERTFLPARLAPALLLLSALGFGACDSGSPLATDPESPPTMLAFAMARLPVCHLTSSATNEYVAIEVAEPAFDVHIAHGDVAIGGPVPGLEDLVFDDACQPVAAACPCFDAADLALLDLGLAEPDFFDSLGLDGARLTTLSTQSLSFGPTIIYDTSNGDVGFCGLDPIFQEDLTRAETEACRVLIYDEAADRGLACVGDACGSTYFDEP
jgi:hypothetical protein